MRELVYLSNRKLRQFDLGRKLRLRARLKAVIKAPLGLGELAVEAEKPQGSPPGLDAVLAALENSDRAPIWFTEALQPGQWVHFEAPMSFTTIRRAVVFLDVERQSAAYPSGGEVRLLLHGSAEHLVGSDSPPHTSVEELSEQAATRSDIHADEFASLFNHFIRLIEYRALQGIEVDDDPAWPFSRHIPGSGLDYALPTLSHNLHLPYTAAWMAGYARVTAVVRRSHLPHSVVFATPLYVEHVSPPDPGVFSAR